MILTLRLTKLESSNIIFVHPPAEIDATAGGDSEYQHDGPLAKAGSRVVVIEVIEGDTRDPSLGVVSQKRAPRLKVFLYDAWADACQNVVKA